MKKLIWLITTFALILVILTGCCDRCKYRVFKQTDWVREDWLRLVNTNPKLWVAGADSWFFNGEPNALEREDIASGRMVAAIIPVSKVADIVINGSFQVQIIGDQDKSSVGMLGPKTALQQIHVNMSNHTLFVTQNPEAHINFSNVIVRIGVRHLRTLINNGSSTVYGRGIITKSPRCECGRQWHHYASWSYGAQ